ncbi:hypothetical protein MZUP3_470 [Erwinia phage vB_EhrS_49]|uniref:Uncharacterized protein n=1 Tax=Erwinia phage vB_EhrS_49 TaxID=2283026 RepID=A0A4Y1NRI0_9CAUD|nr:hypothetical protein HOV54_gp47 [Erwinia phage vB_EhrS_49]AXH43461.1 hypothetical protein MZUP3_470 [Erwinia phage vB_EhrS_49]
MSEFKGTPGPWERGGGENGGGELLVYCNNSLGSAICDATSHYSVFDKRTKIANLDLMAAAPDLLEACLRIQAQFRQAGITSVAGSVNPAEDSSAQIDAAILKALGE